MNIYNHNTLHFVQGTYFCYCLLFFYTLYACDRFSKELSYRDGSLGTNSICLGTDE